jgi:pilus assembly protein CpaC
MALLKVWLKADVARRMLACCVALIFVSLTPLAYATPNVVEIGDKRLANLRIAGGKAQTVRTQRPFADLVVGNPDIADAMPLSDQTLYVVGKKIGTTNVSLYDKAKKLVTVIDIEISADLPNLRADMPRGTMPVSTANGRTVLSGTMPDGPSAARASALAKQYGSDVINTMMVRGSQQVMLEVRFVEASRSIGKELGIRWDAVGRNFGSPNRAADNVGFVSGTVGLASGNPAFGALIGRVLSSGVEADVMIQALEDKGLARRLAEPNLVALSGEPASFLAGGEFPFPIQGDQGRISIEFKKFGVGLTFTPTVLQDGLINLKIEPEVSQLDPTNVIRTGGVTVPGLIVRRANTMIQLRDGQSFSIAGLLQSVSSNTQQQIPWIGDIPVLGTLFRSAAFERRETDLAIIVTPRLVRPTKPGERLRTPLDNLQAGNDIDLFLNGKSEVPFEPAATSSANRAASTSGHMLDLNTNKGDTISAAY